MHDSMWHSGCTPHRVSKVLLIIGGLNWGLVGLGMLMNKGMDWNVVHMILSSAPMLEGIVYVLVGVAAFMKIFQSRCKSCMNCMNGSCGHKGMGNMDRNM